MQEKTGQRRRLFLRLRGGLLQAAAPDLAPDIAQQFRFVFADAQPPDFVGRMNLKPFGERLNFFDTQLAQTFRIDIHACHPQRKT